MRWENGRDTEGFEMDKVTVGQTFLLLLRSPCQYHSTNAPYSVSQKPAKLKVVISLEGLKLHE
jgi:hypothetical protein